MDPLAPDAWIPAYAGMTAGGEVPAYAGMTAGVWDDDRGRNGDALQAGARFPPTRE